jgi:predicted transcriptional regulator
LTEGNVQRVREALAPRRALAYTTVMTMLDRLASKGLVTRRKVGRSFLYTPAVTRDEVRQRAIRELADALFDGSRDKLVRFLSGASPSHPPASPESSPSLDTTLL